MAKSVVFVIYAVLLQGQFCRDLRDFAWRKIEPKIVLVEKKGQISGMDENEQDTSLAVPEKDAKHEQPSSSSSSSL